MFKFTIFFLFIFVNHRILVSLSQRLYMAIYILFFPIITWKWKCFTLWCHFLLRKKVTFHCGWLELVNFLTPRSRHGAGKVIVPGSMMRHMFGSRKKVFNREMEWVRGTVFFSGMLWIRGIFSENWAVEIDKFEFFRQIRTLASLKAHKWYIRTEAKIYFTFKNMIYVIIYSLVFFLRWYETSIDINVD